MDKHKPQISIDNSKCSACVSLVCVGVCPQGILEVDPERKMRLVDVASCTFCGVCVDLCPAKAITISHGSAPGKGR